jgi:D-arginine dehydrogenase
MFAEADPDYFPSPLLSPRGILFVADEAGKAEHEQRFASAEGISHLDRADAAKMVPLLKAERIAAAAYEADAQDIDVNALHQGWLRQAKDVGARLVTDAPVRSGRRSGGQWVIEAGDKQITATVVVNAAGAWADHIAQAFGVPAIGLTPMRRTIGVLPTPEGHMSDRWPLVADSDETWYFKPEAGRLLVSPADEDPVEPHDAFVDDMVLAEGLYRYEQAVNVPVTRVERSWAGLRTFAPDRTPVAGYDPQAEGFFWLAGQGGYGIQTSPALSALAAALVKRETPSGGLAGLDVAVSPGRFANRD